MSTSTPDPSTATPAPTFYTVNRVQDGEQVRAELDIDTAKSECAILNAQARMPIGQTMDGTALYASMVSGEISRFEVRSATTPLVVA